MVCCELHIKRKLILTKMPGLIGVIEFVDETREDYSSPTTSNFVYRMPQCRQTISSLEEVRSNVILEHPDCDKSVL